MKANLAFNSYHLVAICSISWCFELADEVCLCPVYLAPLVLVIACGFLIFPAQSPTQQQISLFYTPLFSKKEERGIKAH